MIRWFALVLAVVVLTSCIGIESRIRFRQDGSGSLTLSYKVSQFLKNLDVGREEKRLPLPVSEQEFSRTAEGIRGLRLLAVNEREDEENVYIEANLEFDTVEAINALDRSGEMGLKLTRAGNTSTFRQVIYPGPGAEKISEDTLEMMETFFKGYDLAYTITVPERIRSHSLGSLSQDGRTVTYRVSVPELLQRSEAVVLEVTW